MDKKPLCPYCGPWNGYPDGVEMEMSVTHCPTKQKAGGYAYEYDVIFHCKTCGSMSPGSGWKGSKKVAEEAARAAALRRFAPMQKPLTLDEIYASNDALLMEFKGEPAGIHDEWVLYSHTEDETCRFWIFGQYCGKEHNINRYGKTWRCWRTRPTDDERRAAAWEEDTNEGSGGV